MKKIAIIGAGQAGLQLGFELLAKSYEVTLYTDKNADDVLNSPVLQVPIQFYPTLQYEKDLGLNFWDAHLAMRVDTTIIKMFSPQDENVLTVGSMLKPAAQAIDLRLKFSGWMNEFEHRGGKLIIEEATIELLEQCAATHDAVFVTTGRGSFRSLFELDEQRTEADRPFRNLTVFYLKDCKPNSEHGPEVHVNSHNALIGLGECLFCGFLHKDNIRAYSFLIEAIPGSPLDLHEIKGRAQEKLDYIKLFLKENFSEIYNILKDSELLEDGVLEGAITPVVKNPVGKLPSGKVVMGIGDAIITHDPLAAQGLNAASKMAHYVAEQLEADKMAAFDAQWINRVFEGYWETAQHGYKLSINIAAGFEPHQELAFYAASQIPEIASDILNNAGQMEKVNAWMATPEATMKHLTHRGFTMQTA